MANQENQELSSFETVIKAYLDDRAAQDSLFSETYKKPKKNIHECCEYILSEVRKKGNAVFMKDEEVYGMAVHYYDEDKLFFKKVEETVKVSSPTPLPIDPNKVIPEPKNEPKDEPKKVTNSSPRRKPRLVQLSLFPDMI